MSKNHMDLAGNVYQNTMETAEDLVFDTSLINVPSCSKCCEACNGCKLRYFNKMKLNKDLMV